MDDVNVFATIPEIIAEAQSGRMFILVDDETRENEGDLVILAEYADPAIINFMITHARGLVCLSLTKDRVGKLQLPMMTKNNGSKLHTPFTISIEAKEGISTGISAFDRAHTIKTAIDDEASDEDIVSPGHIFPLLAKDGGVLVRAGHTEASVDIARLAGRKLAAVICEIMNEDGTMARVPDLITYAKKYNLKIGTIADLIAYRRQNEKLVELIGSKPLVTDFAGDFMLQTYKNLITEEEHIALVKGSFTDKDVVPVRVHKLNLIADLFSTKNDMIRNSMKYINERGAGAIIVLSNEKSNEVLSYGQSLVDYGIGAQIIQDLGIRKMQLITSKKKNIVALLGYGLEIVDYIDLKQEKQNKVLQLAL